MSGLKLTTVPRDLYYHEVDYVRGLEAEIERLSAALTLLAKKYEDQNISHLDFRVLVKMEAEAALAPSPLRERSDRG